MFFNGLLGTVIGSVLGGGAGLLLSLNRFVWASVEPIVEFLRALPSVVLVPLVSIFVGVGSSSRIVCATIIVAVYMISASASGVNGARRSHLRLARAWRATPTQRLIYFYFPSVLTSMAIALRAAIPIALIVIVAADMLIATDSGIGKTIMDSLAVFNMPRMYAAVAVVGLLGYGAAVLSDAIASKAIHWGKI